MNRLSLEQDTGLPVGQLLPDPTLHGLLAQEGNEVVIGLTDKRPFSERRMSRHTRLNETEWMLAVAVKEELQVSGIPPARIVQVHERPALPHRRCKHSVVPAKLCSSARQSNGISSVSSTSAIKRTIERYSAEYSPTSQKRVSILRPSGRLVFAGEKPGVMHAFITTPLHRFIWVERRHIRAAQYAALMRLHRRQYGSAATYRST